MPTRIWWTRVPYGDGRWLVYSPRFGRTYLLSSDSATSSAVPALLGLKAAAYRDALIDPADTVGLVDRADPNDAVGRFMRLLYRSCHKHRTVLSIGRVIRLATWLARLQRGHPEWGTPEVGRLCMEVERSVGISDCYPRALLTAYLCMIAGLPCAVTVGILAPTANMHAWCTTAGAIPYEPEPEHWFYRPLAVFDVTG